MPWPGNPNRQRELRGSAIRDNGNPNHQRGNLIEGFMEALIKGFMAVLHLVVTYTYKEDLISQEFVGDNRF